MATVIFDIEASCDDKTKNPNYNMETIEIGAVKVLNGEIIDTFETFILPEYTSDLTPFCTELTGITFEDLKGAPQFAQAILEFYSFIYGSDIYSCGEFDRKFLTRELDDKGNTLTHNLVRNAINSTHTDLKKLFSKITGKKKQGMIGMAKELDVELTGDIHRALADSLNLTKIYLELEKIRETELKRFFYDDKVDNLIKAINENHERHFIEKENDIFFIKCKTSQDLQEVKFLEFIDIWSDVIITDITERGLNYITPHQLKCLRKYAK